MAENKTYTFVISDESVNSYGFRTLTDGIDLTLFKKNPIALWVHKRMWGLREEILPIGRWVNLRKENGKLLGDLEFDEDDDFAVKLQKKVDKKIINMVSPGLRPLTWSDDPKHIEKGQTRATLIKCIVREISLVDIGSNGNALRLFDDGGEEINLSDNGNGTLIPLLDFNNQNNDMEFHKQIAQVLKLSDGASEADVLAAVQNSVNSIAKLSDLKGQVTTLSEAKSNLETELQGYKDAEKQADKQKRIDLVDGAITDKKITAEEREDYLSFAEKDYELCEKQLNKLKGVQELGAGGNDVKLSAWDQRMQDINNNLKNKK